MKNNTPLTKRSFLRLFCLQFFSKNSYLLVTKLFQISFFKDIISLIGLTSKMKWFAVSHEENKQTKKRKNFCQILMNFFVVVVVNAGCRLHGSSSGCGLPKTGTDAS
jgi:hypothetical protein